MSPAADAAVIASHKSSTRRTQTGTQILAMRNKRLGSSLIVELSCAGFICQMSSSAFSNTGDRRHQFAGFARREIDGPHGVNQRLVRVPTTVPARVTPD